VKTGVRVVSDSSAVCGPEWKTLDRIIVREAGCPRRVDQPDVDVVLDGPLDGGAGAVGTQLHFIRPARSGSPMVPSAYGDRLACWRDGTAEITARLRDLDDDLAGVNVPEIVVRTDDQAVSLGCSTAAIAKANGGLGR